MKNWAFSVIWKAISKRVLTTTTGTLTLTRLTSLSGFNLGFSQSGAGNYEKAIEAYEYASLLNDKYTYALFNLGNAYANAGKFSKAIEKYTEYLEFDPNNDDAWSYTGECYLNLEEHSKLIIITGKR